MQNLKSIIYFYQRVVDWITINFHLVLKKNERPTKIELLHVNTFIYSTRLLSWLKHCTTSRKAADSIPGDVIEVFHWCNPSGRTMVLGSTQPLK